MTKAGISSNDVGRIVFVGGPTQYKPLRDKIAFELGIAPSTDVKPMVAVAEGAAVFAESIDWSSTSRTRKTSRGAVSTGGELNVSLNFVARTPSSRAPIAVKVIGEARAGSEIQVDSLDTGWSSGRSALKDGIIEVPLSKPGDNSFKIFVFDANGGPTVLPKDKLTITRTAASVDAIPASHSIGIEVRARAGGSLMLDYIVKEGETLPKKGVLEFKSEATLTAQSADSLRFKLWEGDISDPITDNRFIGMFEIKGRDFDEGVIAAGAQLICEYEILDSGNIFLEVSIPSISGSFHSGRNYYSRQEGLRDLTQAAMQVRDEVEHLVQRVNETEELVSDVRLEEVRARLDKAGALRPEDTNPENAGEALQDIHEAKKLLAQVRKANIRAMRTIDLDRATSFFDEHVRSLARPSESSAFDNLASTAQRAIDNNTQDFESHLDDLRGRTFAILWRQDWFVIDRFNMYASERHRFANQVEHQRLVDLGLGALKEPDIDKLRDIVAKLGFISVSGSDEDSLLATSNIVRG
jgi:molecular chaperone DnaK